MKLQGAGKLVRIYLGASDRRDGQWLPNEIVQRARQAQIARLRLSAKSENSRLRTRFERQWSTKSADLLYG